MYVEIYNIGGIMKYVSKFFFLSFFLVTKLFCSVDQDIVATKNLIELVEKSLSENKVSGAYWKFVTSNSSNPVPTLWILFSDKRRVNFKHSSTMEYDLDLPEDCFSNSFGAEKLAKELNSELCNYKYGIFSNDSLLKINLPVSINSLGLIFLQPRFYTAEMKKDLDKNPSLFVDKFNEHFGELSKKQSVRICSMIEDLYQRIIKYKYIRTKNGSRSYISEVDFAYLYFLADLIAVDLYNLKELTKKGCDIDIDCVIKQILKLMFFDNNEAISTFSSILQHCSCGLNFENISAISEFWDLLKLFLMTDSKYFNSVVPYYPRLEESCNTILAGNRICHPMRYAKRGCQNVLNIIQALTKAKNGCF